MARDPSRRRRKRPADVVSQRPWRRVSNPYKPITVLSADQIEQIHRASLDVIETLGADIWCDEALDIFGAAGAEVDRPNRHVRIDRAIIEDAVAKAPAEFTLTPRNPARAIAVGGNNINFSIVAGPGFSTDLDRGRRSGTFADACDLIRLSQCLEVIHLTGGGPVAATDMAVPIRHLETLRASLTLTDKVSYGSAFGARRVNDAVDMTCIARGVDRAGLAESPGLIGNINCNSPLRYDGPMTEGIIEFARAGQPIIITPFTLAGAMAPITLAGALTQQNAEALIGIALAQLVNPGAPVVYGGFTSNVDMKSARPPSAPRNTPRRCSPAASSPGATACPTGRRTSTPRMWSTPRRPMNRACPCGPR